MRNVISFDRVEFFIFENNRIFFVIEIYLIKHDFLFKVWNVDFDNEK